MNTVLEKNNYKWISEFWLILGALAKNVKNLRQFELAMLRSPLEEAWTDLPPCGGLRVLLLFF